MEINLPPPETRNYMLTHRLDREHFMPLEEYGGYIAQAEFADGEMVDVVSKKNLIDFAEDFNLSEARPLGLFLMLSNRWPTETFVIRSYDDVMYERQTRYVNVLTMFEFLDSEQFDETNANHQLVELFIEYLVDQEDKSGNN